MTALPGVGVHELTDAGYFAPALAAATLSSTGARELLKPGGPARFRHQADAGTVEIKREYDLGHAVHTLVLGSGPEPVEVSGTGANPEAWQKADDKARVAQVRAEGKVPLRPADYAAAVLMATAVRHHPIAAKLLGGSTPGAPERTLIWRDQASGVLCRAKADWLRPDGIVDLKTTADASPDALSKAVHGYGYAVQAAFYLRGVRALDLATAPFFVFVAVEKAPPYLVHVTQLGPQALAWGERQVTRALEVFRDCTAAGRWPGYPDDEITEIDLPAWVRTEEY